ncbi:uncharacterized protein LOC123703514 [Colias croceus]|uniref:uncharacterized protein LOC123700573 n=1 Tax=Colias crocea TaxID=72248 RepID=UPI001E27BA34|nr:uncharacterized protein LOC123700573 [Colias croceus]XP_045507510.1 uncharacterized protein LOC123703514 [Colias croceus]
MDCEIVKGKPLTKEESKFLLDLIEGSKIITTKTTNATNNKIKNEEWVRLTERFNAQATNCPRTPQQLRLKWENLKKNSRKRSTKIRMNQIKTGGGPADYIPPDDILDRVSGLLGSTASGFTVPFGGDKETVGVDIGGMSGDGGTSGDGIGDGFARVSDDISKAADLMPTSSNHDIEIVICSGEGDGVIQNQVSESVDQNVLTPNKPKRFTLNTPRTGNFCFSNPILNAFIIELKEYPPNKS